MSTARKLQIKNSLVTSTKIWGNTGQKAFNLCSDLINQHGLGKKDRQAIMDGTGLSFDTLDRMSKLTETELGDPYNPSSDTIDRIMVYFGVEGGFDQVVIKARYRNKPKNDA